MGTLQCALNQRSASTWSLDLTLSEDFPSLLRYPAVNPAGWLERNAGLASSAEYIASMILFESHLGRHGSSYAAIASYPLAG